MLHYICTAADMRLWLFIFDSRGAGYSKINEQSPNRRSSPMIGPVFKSELPECWAPKKDGISGMHYNSEKIFTIKPKSGALCDTMWCFIYLFCFAVQVGVPELHFRKIHLSEMRRAVSLFTWSRAQNCSAQS